MKQQVGCSQPFSLSLDRRLTFLLKSQTANVQRRLVSRYPRPYQALGVEGCPFWQSRS